MKKLTLLVPLLCLAATAMIHAQNALPANGNVGVGTAAPTCMVMHMSAVHSFRPCA